MNATTADYALGLEVDWREQRVAAPDASRRERMANDWPKICQSLNCFKPVTGDNNRAWIPPLLDHWRDGEIEYFDVAVPAIFVSSDQTPNNTNPMSMLAQRLSAACGAKAEKSIMLNSTADLRSQGQARCRELFGGLDVPVRRLALSFFSLPTDLWLDPAKIPESPVEFYLGLLSDGSDAIWNAAQNPHACIGGATGSGKTTSAEALFLQQHYKGGQLHLYTAKVGDRVMQQFARFPQHTVLAGVRGTTIMEDLGRVLTDLRGVRAEVERRQSIRADHGVEWWRDVPAEVRGDASTVLVVFDESRSFFPIREMREDQQVTDLKRQVAGEVDNLAQIARQEDVFLVIMTQSPYVETLGSGFVQDQVHLWWTIRKLAAKWIPTAYGQSDSPNPKRLVPGDLPRGRAVVRGVTAPDNPFGEEAVRDGMMQSTRVTDEVRQLLLDQAPIPQPEPVADPEPDEPFTLGDIGEDQGFNGSPPPVGPVTGAGYPISTNTLALMVVLPAFVAMTVLLLIVGGVLLP